MTLVPVRSRSRPWLPWAIASVLVLGLGWAYAGTLTNLVQRWWTDPQMSHGFLIPLVAGFLLWQWRDSRPRSLPDSFCWWGVAILACSALFRLWRVYISLDWFDGFSVLLALTGLVVLVGGWPALRWCWPALAYLLFLLPLPYQIETALSAPLQRLATLASCYTLQTLGYPAIPEGNVIVLEHCRVGVVEKCNGLGMLLAFFAISTAAALLVQRPWLDRVLLVVSAIPIGIAVNLIRISATAVAYQTLGPQQADQFFHTWAGWLMMPLAVAALALEMWLLKKLLVQHPTVTPSAPPLRPGATATAANWTALKR